MRDLSIFLSIAVLAIGLLACGGSSTPAVPTLPPLPTVGSAGARRQPAPASQPSEGRAPVDVAAEPPRQIQGDGAPLAPPWPTFTPGPDPQSEDRLIYARTRRFYTANADGSNMQALKFENDSPQLLAQYKDPGRGWLSPDGRYLLYFADQVAQLWLADLESLGNQRLAERMLPAGKEGDKATIRTLTDQVMSWTSDNTRVAFIGMPDTVDLFTVDLTTGQLTRVTQDGLSESRPQWSPDGRYLAYAATNQETGNQALYVLDARAQPPNPAEIDMRPVREVFDMGPGSGFAFINQLVWVSDTQFVFYPHSSGRSNGIWLYDVTAKTMEPVLAERVDRVRWSAEARAWAYSKPDAPGTLWLLRLNDSKSVPLVEGEAYAPVWSPNGQSVLYSWSDPESTGWDLRVVDLNGNDRTLARDVSLIQKTPSEPGPAGKRYWSPDGKLVLYTAVGRDYGRAERQAGYGGEAGPDLENWWIVPASGGEARRATDMQKVFYVQEPRLSPDGTVWAYVAFSYTDRVQHLYTMAREGGHPKHIDAGVRWFRWLP